MNDVDVRLEQLACRLARKFHAKNSKHFIPYKDVRAAALRGLNAAIESHRLDDPQTIEAAAASEIEASMNELLAARLHAGSNLNINWNVNLSVLS